MPPLTRPARVLPPATHAKLLPPKTTFYRLPFAAALFAFNFSHLLPAVSPPPATGREYMVSTAQHEATEVGCRILEAGGNAVDAAVGIGYALAVSYPVAGNLGGGGFMLVHFANGRGDTFINFRERAPGRASREMFLDAAGNVAPGRSTDSYLAVGVPGTPAGLDYALGKYGTISRQQAIAPAIGLARDGFILAPGDVELLAGANSKFRTEANVAAIFTRGGAPFRVGDRLVQPDLARTFSLLSAEGPAAFYRGEIAGKIITASEANGGMLSRKDFEDYTVQEMAPIRAGYRGFDLVSAPPPSSGGVILSEILNILSAVPLGEFGWHSARAVHWAVEAERHAYLDRTELGDPDFVKNPVERLLSAEHASAIRGQIDPVRATPSSQLKAGAMPPAPAPESPQTTHYSVVDRWGNAVAVTYTLNSAFGSKRIAGDTGFFLNNEMDDFTSKPGSPNQFGLIQGEGNAVGPGKRPLSSMTPTILLKDGQVFLVTGSPGGSRIITIALETILNVVDYHMNVQEAVDAPRVHHQWQPDIVYHEPYALGADTVMALRVAGYENFVMDGSWGSAQAVEIPYADLPTGPPVPAGQMSVGRELKAGVRYGGSDHRSPSGSASGR